MVIGITGGIGSGKSKVLSIINENIKCNLLLTDNIAKELQKPGTKTYMRLMSHFGVRILNEDGTINNEVLAKLAFSNKNETKALNDITHPGVIEYVKNFIKNHINEINVVESALLLDCELKDICDSIWYVHSNIETRKNRLKINRNYSEEKILEMFKTQKTDEYFFKHCDVIITNENLEETKKIVKTNLIKLTNSLE